MESETDMAEEKTNDNASMRYLEEVSRKTTLFAYQDSNTPSKCQLFSAKKRALSKGVADLI